MKIFGNGMTVYFAGVDPAKFETPWLRGILRRYPLEGLDSTASDKEKDAEAVAEASAQMTDASISIADMNLPLSTPKPSFADLQAELSGAELVKELHGEGFLEDPQGLWVIVESLVSVKGISLSGDPAILSNLHHFML